LLERVSGAPEESSDVEQVLFALQEASSLAREMQSLCEPQESQPKLIDLGQSVYGCRNWLKHIVGNQVRVNLGLLPGVIVQLEPSKLRRLLLNICSNARDAMGGRGVLEIRASIEYRSAEAQSDGCLHTKGSACLRIADSGVGMTPSVKERIFQPFFTTKAFGQGTGIGLTNVLDIVKQSQGRVRVDTTPGIGTCFSFYWPLVNPEHDARARTSD
jgi:signal transduction histidine kinase